MALLKRLSPKKKTQSQDAHAPVVEHARARTAGNEMIGILRHPHVTEKTAAAGAHRTYVFAIAPHANKRQVKKAVEERYGVKVANVRIVTIGGKKVRRGAQIGRRPGIKKAYTTLAEGQTIETL